jgi:diguanylate cyclase (GGDEF)-like protein
MATPRSGPAAAVAAWPFWSVRPAVKVVVLTVFAAAVGAVLLAARAVPAGLAGLAGGRTWIWFGVLAVGSVVHAEAARRIERLRETASQGAPWINLKSVWTFAGLLLLPLVLVDVLVVVTYLHTWIRVTRRVVVHRWMYSMSMIIVASSSAGAVMHLISPAPVAPGAGPAGPLAVLVAGVTRWVINVVLVTTVIKLSAPDTPLRKALGRPTDQLIDAASLALGALIAVVLTYAPAYVPAVLLPVLAVHRSLLLHQFQVAARSDPKTGLLNAGFWHEAAGHEVRRAVQALAMAGRAAREGVTGLLLIDLDHFKRVNDRYGHPAGDLVLRAVADALRRGRRATDLVGRFGGEEFAILVPSTTPAQLVAMAQRICQDIRDLRVSVLTSHGARETVAGLSVSIGVAHHPDAGQSLDQLMLRADSALFAAKSAGRDQVTLTSAPTA